MLKKLSHVANRGKHYLHFKTFFNAMGDILASLEIQDEPDDDGFKRDAENIRRYFYVVEQDIETAISQSEPTIMEASAEKHMRESCQKKNSPHYWNDLGCRYSKKGDHLSQGGHDESPKKNFPV